MKILIDKQLYQWERGRTVRIEKSSLESDVTSVHFYNREFGEAYVRLVIGDYAEIPDELLQEYLPIYAVACANNQVLATAKFYVTRRAKPENYSESGVTELHIIYDGGVEV